MGYSTTFWGSVSVSPALNKAERDYLTTFAGTRREPGPLWPRQVAGEPSWWCHWAPSTDGSTLRWDGQEKFYAGTEWMAYLIDNFLRPEATAAQTGDAQFAGFTFDHRCSGTIFALASPELGVIEAWRLEVVGNVVTHHEYHVPVLDLDDDAWEEVEDDESLDIEYAFTLAMQGKARGLRQLTGALDRYAELGQQPVIVALQAFGSDLAQVHPEPASLLAALGLPPAS